MKNRKGFTLIELMIVVAIIGILAAVAIPKFASMLEKAREGATQGNIGAIKSAISIYYGDRQGAWPSDLTQATTANPVGFQKYLDKVPPVKVTHPAGTLGGTALLGSKTDITMETVTNVAVIGSDPATYDGWKYNTTNGGIWVYNAQTDSGGTTYSMYGY